MTVTITSRKFKARDTLKTFINDEVETLKKYNDDIMDVEVILSYQKPNDNTKTTELIVKIPGTILTAKDEAEEYPISVRGAVEKMIRQLKKIKSKKNEFVRE